MEKANLNTRSFPYPLPPIPKGDGELDHKNFIKINKLALKEQKNDNRKSFFYILSINLILLLIDY